MKLVIQRVSQASVVVENQVVGKISRGFAVLAGFTHQDTKAVVDKITEKLVNLRLMADSEGKMNRSLQENGGELLLIPQFTLYADTKGNRPGFTQAAPPKVAQPLFNYFVEQCKKSGLKVETGVFGAYMKVELVNDGPVTIILEN